LFTSIIVRIISFFHKFQVTYFKWLGGYTLKDSVHYCMTESLSKEISNDFTWWGNEKKKKLPLYKSKLIQAIYRTYAIIEYCVNNYKLKVTYRFIY